MMPPGRSVAPKMARVSGVGDEVLAVFGEAASMSGIGVPARAEMISSRGGRGDAGQLAGRDGAGGL